LGAMQVGVPVAPVSPAYSLMSRDYAKVHDIRALVRPALLYVENPEPFQGVLGSLDFTGLELVTAVPGWGATKATPFKALLETRPGPAVEDAYAGVGPDSVAKYLFTSGSTGTPKGVINTQKMLCANQAQSLAVWPFIAEEPPVLLDWLPWNHTFGANYNFNL